MRRKFLLCFAVCCFVSLVACQKGREEQTPMKPSVFGVLKDGREVYEYTLANNTGMTITCINYGATITSLSVPDRNGQSSDVVLGYDSLEGYINGSAYFGAVVGRYGNRIGSLPWMEKHTSWRSIMGKITSTVETSDSTKSCGMPKFCRMPKRLRYGSPT